MKDQSTKKEKTDLTFPLSYTEELEEEMKNSYIKVNVDSHVDSSLHYYMSLPENVRPTSLKEQNIPGTDIVKEIGYFQTIDESPYLEIQVVYQSLKFEINPSDWLFKFLEKNNDELVKTRIKKGEAGNYLDALTKKTLPGGETVVSRSTAIKNYDKASRTANIVAVKASCNIEDYPELADEMMAIAINWDFINKTEYQLAEDLKLFDTENSMNMSFYYPASWDSGRFTREKNLPERFAIFNKNKNKDAKGAINIFLSKTDDTTKLVDEVIERFKENDMPLEISPLEQVKYPIKNDQISKQWKASGTISDSKQKFDGIIRVMITKVNEYLVMTELVGPSREVDFQNWARNKRAQNLIFQTLSIPSEEK